MSELPVKVLIAGTIRNGASALEKTIEILDRAFNPLAEVRFLIIESDSEDDTLAILERMRKNRQNFAFESLGALTKTNPKRTDRIATARNEYLTQFQKHEKYRDCTHLVVADLDGVNDLLTTSGVKSSLVADGLHVYTANQLGPYYDIWALRHSLWSPNDCWSELEFYRKWYHLPEYVLQRSVLSRMIRIKPSEEMIEVDSAFGGLAIYPRNAVEGLSYSGLDLNNQEVCEHVEFSYGVKRNGYKIFINPQMINTKYTEMSIEKKISRSILRFLKYPLKTVIILARK